MLNVKSVAVKFQGRVEFMDNDFGDRIARLEARVEALEQRGSVPVSGLEGHATRPTAPPVIAAFVKSRQVIPADMNQGRFFDFMLFDIDYVLSNDVEGPATAAKGILQFADMFGEAKLNMEITIEGPLHPGAAISVTDEGFQLNEYDVSHKWMKDTDLKNMKFRFRTQQLLRPDGSIEHLNEPY